MMELTKRELDVIIRAVSSRMSGHKDDLRRCELSGQGDTTYAQYQRQQITLFESVLQKIKGQKP